MNAGMNNRQLETPLQKSTHESGNDARNKKKIILLKYSSSSNSGSTDGNSTAMVMTLVSVGAVREIMEQQRRLSLKTLTSLSMKSY
jgi:hypothetical protein